jgi:parallel beta-helix repeat protein
VQRFVRHLRRGQVGCLRGSFRSNLTIRHSGFRLTSSPGSKPATIDGVVYVARSAHRVVLSRLVLRASGGPSVRINGTAITIRQSDISNGHRGICVSVGGAFEHWGIAVGVALVRNRIHDCGRLPATNHDHGIYVEGATGTTIRGNLIYDNADRGVQLYPTAQHTLVIRNVIDGNGEGVIFSGEAAGGEYSRAYASSDNVVTRNIISNSRERHNVESWWGGPVGTANVVRDNCLWNGVLGNLDLTGGGFLATGNVVGQPRFVDRAAADFRLAPGSPCAGLGPR